jgi:precorrin-6B methylase 2
MVRSLRNRGLAWSADRALSVIQERLFDLRYGTDTISFAELNTLSITGENVSQGKPYQPTRLRLLRRVFAAINVPPQSALVDFGCGKGRVLLVAAECGFRRVTGVEFAHELCEIATDNVARYRAKSGVGADIQVIEGDAVEYAIQPDENVFFFANPFGEALVERVMQNINRSAQSDDRQIFVVYSNPVWATVMERQRLRVYRNIGSGDCMIYTNK